MPPPTILKRRHTLRGKNLLPVIKKLRGMDQPVPQLARFKINTALEEMERSQVVSAFRDLTGESEKDCLEMAERDITDENLKCLLHSAIIHANEFGQPDGQNLETIEDQESEPQEPPKKKTKASSPEKLTIDDIEVENVKEKVRSLALQTKPSVPLILVTLDELARTAGRKGHSEASMYEELSRQAYLNQEKIDIQSFCLNVLGGNASDIVGKALSKAIKIKPEMKSTEMEKINFENQAHSPLLNLYGQPNYMGYMQPQFNFAPNTHQMGAPYGYRRYQRPSYRHSRSAGCLFCGAGDHYVRGCTKMKAARGKMNSQ